MIVCKAPTVAIRLSPDGQVHTCGPNWEHVLGNVAEQSLGEIWHGPRAVELRAAIDRGDFSLGCRDCEADYRSGSRALSHAAIYDRFNVADDARWPRRIEFALSNTCNLQCLQCNGELSSAIRSRREHRPPLVSPYGEAFYEELESFLPHLEMATFMGGEPFLARESRRVWDMLLELDDPPEVHVTTNGTIWNDRVEHYVRALRMNVSVSLDGVSAETNDVLRVGSDIDGIRAVRDRLAAIAAEYGGVVTMNFCLMQQNWRDLVPYMLETEELGAYMYATRVVHPASFSLFSLPAPELREVVETWHRADEEMQDRLEINRGVWIETVASLERHLDALEGTAAVAVELSSRSTDDQARRRVEELAEEFHRWSGRPSMRVEVRGGQVVEVEAHDWAATLRPSDWLGVDVGALLPLVESAASIQLGAPTVLESGDVNVWSFTPPPPAAFELRVAFVPWQDVRLRGLDIVLNASGELPTP